MLLCWCFFLQLSCNAFRRLWITVRKLEVIWHRQTSNPRDQLSMDRLVSEPELVWDSWTHRQRMWWGPQGRLVLEFKPVDGLRALPSCRHAYPMVKQAMEILLHKSFGVLPEKRLNFPTSGGSEALYLEKKKKAVLGSKMTNLSDFRDPAALFHGLVQLWGAPGTHKGSFFTVTDKMWLYGWYMGCIILPFSLMETLGKASLWWEWFPFA